MSALYKIPYLLLSISQAPVCLQMWRYDMQTTCLIRKHGLKRSDINKICPLLPHHPVGPKSTNRHPHKLATDGCTCFNVLTILLFYCYDMDLRLGRSNNNVTNGCWPYHEHWTQPLLLVNTVGQNYIKGCIPKPYTTKIQSAGTICGSYLGHGVCRKTMVTSNENL